MDILAGRPAAITVTWHDQDGEINDNPGLVTVTATRDDGTAQPIAASVTTSNGISTVQMTAAEVGADLDTLTVRWSSATQGVLTSRVRIVGEHIVSLSQIRGDTNSATAYPTVRLREARDWFTDLAESYCDVAFRPVAAVHTLTAARPTFPHPVRTVRWAQVDGQDVDVSGWTVSDGIVNADTYAARITVGYTHGLDRVPDRIRDAAAVACLDWLRTGKADRRVARQLTEADQFGNLLRISYARWDRPTGIPLVDAALNNYRRPAVA